jgi:hypothetical protein
MEPGTVFGGVNYFRGFRGVYIFFSALSFPKCTSFRFPHKAQRLYSASEAKRVFIFRKYIPTDSALM